MSAPSNREPLDLEAIRALCDAATPGHDGSRYACAAEAILNILDLLDEIERLRADREKFLAESQRWYEEAHALRLELAAERRRVERVRALCERTLPQHVKDQPWATDSVFIRELLRAYGNVEAALADESEATT